MTKRVCPPRLQQLERMATHFIRCSEETPSAEGVRGLPRNELFLYRLLFSGEDKLKAKAMGQTELRLRKAITPYIVRFYFNSRKIVV